MARITKASLEEFAKEVVKQQFSHQKRWNDTLAVAMVLTPR